MISERSACRYGFDQPHSRSFQVLRKELTATLDKIGPIALTKVSGNAIQPKHDIEDLGLMAPWEVAKVDLDTVLRRIDFEVRCNAKLLNCPDCNTATQGIHDRLRGNVPGRGVIRSDR